MPASELNHLVRRLGEVQKLRSTRFKIIFLCTLFGVFGFLFLGFSAADIVFKLPLVPRAVASSACLVAMLLTLAKLIHVGLAQRRRLRNLAAEVERLYPQIETSLSTSVEFGNDPDRTERLSSPSIVAALVAETEQRTGALNFLAAINWRRAVAAACVFLMAIGLCGFYSIEHTRLARLTFFRMVQPWKKLPPPTLTMAEVYPTDCSVRKLGTLRISAYLSGRPVQECRIAYGEVEAKDAKPAEWRNEPMTPQEGRHYTFTFSRLTQSLKFRVSAGDFLSDEYFVNVYEVPRVVRINMTLTYPEYCGLGAKNIKDSIGPITALRGTVVQIHAFANKPLRRAGVRFSSGEPSFIAALMPKPDELVAQFVVKQNDRYKIWLADADGHTNEDAVFYTIKALEDKKPVVKLKRPKKNIFAKKTTEVLLEVNTTDDFGVSKVGIAYKAKTDEETRVPIDEFVQRMTKATSMDTLYLEELELADTDIVTYYAYAIDNDTVTGPKEGVSKLHFIEITPYAQQYMKDEQPAGGGKKKDKDKVDKDFIPKLDDIIKAQKAILSKTFTLDNNLPPKLTDQDVTQIVDIGSTQDSLRKKTEQLARRLVENLMKLGLEEHIDRAQHLWRGTNEMGLAAYVLAKLHTSAALPYENNALYHLYRAKRDLIHLIKETKDPELRKKLEQALSLAGKQQQEDMQQDIEKEMEELRQQAKEIQQMRDKQKELNKQMEKLAEQKLKQQQAQQQAQQKTQQPSQQQPKPGQVAKEQKQLAKEAERKSLQLRAQDQRSDKLSFAPAREMDQAGYEMQKAAKSLDQNKPDQAKESGKKADKFMQKAMREIKRAMERSLAQQLKDAADKAKELAERQKQLGKQTEQQAKTGQTQQQPKPGQQQQQGQQKQLASAKQTGQQKQDAQQQGQGADQKDQQQQDKTAASPKAKAQQRDEAMRKLAQGNLEAKQDEVRRELKALGQNLQRLSEKVKLTEPDIGKDVEQIAKRAQTGKAQEQMKQAARELAKKRLDAARAPQRKAEKELDNLAKDAKQAAEQFDMDDAERLARAIDKAERIAKKQEQINKQLGQMQQLHRTSPTLKRQADKALKDQQAAKQDTQDLAKQVDRIRALQEAGMDEQIRETVEKAADKMQEAQQQIAQQQPKAAERKGREARKELDQTVKAMRRQMKEALSQKLAKAVEDAKKATDAQNSSKQAAQKAAEQQAKAGKPRHPQDAKSPQQLAAQQATKQAAQQAAQDQADAKAQTLKLAKELDDIKRQAQKNLPDMTKSVDKIAREMKAQRPIQRMDRAQRELQAQRFRNAQPHQQAAAKTLAQAHAKLDDLYQDTTSMPLQTLKAAQKEAEQLAKQLDKLQKQTNQISAKPGARPGQPKQTPQDKQAEKQLDELMQKQLQTQEQTDRFADRMERLNPTVKDKKTLEELKGKMKDVAAKLGERQLKDATAGLGKSKKLVQHIGDGIIKRIKRMVDERKRKEPMEEHAPDEYRDLVRRYYQALSAK